MTGGTPLGGCGRPPLIGQASGSILHFRGAPRRDLIGRSGGRAENRIVIWMARVAGTPGVGRRQNRVCWEARTEKVRQGERNGGSGSSEFRGGVSGLDSVGDEPASGRSWRALSQRTVISDRVHPGAGASTAGLSSSAEAAPKQNRPRDLCRMRGTALVPYRPQCGRYGVARGVVGFGEM